MLVFEERGKPEFPEKNLSEQSREPTNSAHIWRRVRESNPGHIGGRRALSPLHQPCSPKLNDNEVLYHYHTDVLCWHGAHMSIVGSADKRFWNLIQVLGSPHFTT